MKKNILSLKLAVISLIIFAVPIVVFGVDTISTGWKIDTGVSNISISIWDSSCKKISNTSAYNYFIPTKTSAEWSAFSTHLPTNVTIGNCITGCGAGLYLSGGSCSSAPAGYYSPDGDDNYYPCGSINLYSTGGAASCSSVSLGYYSIGGDSSTRTGQSSCGSNAYYCSGGVRYSVDSGYYSTGGTSLTRTGETIAPLGSYASGGVAYQCAAGRYGNTTGNISDQCNGECQAGYYCPAGTWYATSNICSAGSWSTSGASSCTLCGENTYNPNQGSINVSACLACLDGESSTAGSSSCSYSICSAGTTNGYPYSNISDSSSQSVSKSVTNGTCSANATCASGTVSISGESSSCSAGYFDNDNSCADGCESRCGDSVCQVGDGESCSNCSDCGTCTCTPGDTQVRYSALTSACGTYSYQQETQTCSALGAWSGTYTLFSAPVLTVRTRYAALTSSCGTYDSTYETQTCQSSGLFDGMFTLTSPPSATTRTRYAALTSSCGVYGSTSETQTCQASGWNGTYTLSSAPSAATRIRYAALTSSCGTYGSTSEMQTCQASGWNGTYILSSAPSAATRTGYMASSVSCGSTCTTQSQTCYSSGWNGTGIGTCSVNNCICSAGSTNGYSYSDINYSSSQSVSKSVANGTCSANATCTSGAVSISGESSSCSAGYFDKNASCADGCESRCGDSVCQVGDGESCSNCSDCGTCTCTPGDTQVRYSALTSACGTYSYQQETQTCSALGAWSGTYTLLNVPVLTVRTRYAALTSSCGTYGSTSETQTCQSSGLFNGTFTLTSPPSATTRTMYAALTTSCGTYGSTSEMQTCQSSGWNGTYTLSSAPSAATRTGYTTSSVDCGSTCTTQSQTCSSSGWSGTGIGTCSVDACVCSAGTYNLSTGVAPCTNCEVGYYCTGGSSHVACTNHTTSSLNSSSCQICLAGYFNADEDWANGCESRCGDGACQSEETCACRDCSPCQCTTGQTQPGYIAATSDCGTYCTSGTQNCVNGYWDTSTYPLTTCNPAYQTRYAALTSLCGTYACGSQTQYCQSTGLFSPSNYTLTSCPPSTTRTAFSALTSACGTYGSSSQTQTCQSNGLWSGTYTLTSPASVTYRTRYAPLTSACGTYSGSREDQVCTSSGTFSGTYTLTSPPSATTQTRYLGLTSSCGTYGCTSQTQTCQSTGVFSPSNYTLTSCPAVTTQTAYQTSSVPYGSTCVYENQVCTSAGFSPDNYDYKTCSVDGAVTCTSWTYSAWSTCSSGVQTRTIVTSSPSGCVGGSPVLSQACCAAGSTVGYSFSSIPYGSILGVSKSVSDGTCSATIACNSGSISVSGDSCNCNPGFSETSNKVAPPTLSCAYCPSGSYCPSGVPIPCPVGSYCSEGASAPTPCPAGTFSNAEGATTCSACPAGTYNSSTGQTSCSTCEANYYCTGGANHTACPSSTISLSGSTSLSSCVVCMSDSSCSDGYYCQLVGAPFSSCGDPLSPNTCQRKCWDFSETEYNMIFLQGDTVIEPEPGALLLPSNICKFTPIDDPRCGDTPTCPRGCTSGGSAPMVIGDGGSDDSCYTTNWLGKKDWHTRTKYLCYLNSSYRHWYGDSCALSSGYTSKNGIVTASGTCAYPQPLSYCGNWICEQDEDSFSCPEDCAGY